MWPTHLSIARDNVISIFLFLFFYNTKSGGLSQPLMAQAWSLEVGLGLDPPSGPWSPLLYAGAHQKIKKDRQ